MTMEGTRSIGNDGEKSPTADSTKNSYGKVVVRSVSSYCFLVLPGLPVLPHSK